MRSVYDFSERLAWSKGRAGNDDIETISALLVGCESVVATHEAADRKGTDFVATLRRGTNVNIDIKRRENGVSAWWKGTPPEPELTLECWSKVGKNGRPGVIGWTLDESKETDYVLYVFDPRDTREVFLLPFVLLRSAFRHHYWVWRETYKVGRCDTWTSRCYWTTESVFIPAKVVLEALTREMRQTKPECNISREPPNGALT